MSAPPPPPPSPVTNGLLPASQNDEPDADDLHCPAAPGEHPPRPAASALPHPSPTPPTAVAMHREHREFAAVTAQLLQHAAALCATAADPCIRHSSIRLRNGDLARAALLKLCDYQASHIRFLATYVQQATPHTPLSGVTKPPRRLQRQVAGSSSAARLEVYMAAHAPTTFVTPASKQDATSPDPPPGPRRPGAHATQRRLNGLEICGGDPPASPSTIGGGGPATSASQPRVRAIQHSLLAVAPPPEGVAVLPTHASLLGKANGQVEGQPRS